MREHKLLYFLGDSITDAGHLWEESGEGLGNGFVRRISQSLDQMEYRCVNKGQDGFTSRDLLRLVRREDFPENLSAVTILIGVNDLPLWKYCDPDWIQRKYASNLEEILCIIRKKFDGRVILAEPFLFPRPDELKGMLPGLYQEQHILKRMADAWNGEYLSLQEPFLVLAQKYGQDRISSDGIHLTEWGNEQLAGHWLETWKDYR